MDLRIPANVVDFLVVLSSIVDQVAGTAGSNFAALRALRAAKVDV